MTFRDSIRKSIKRLSGANNQQTIFHDSNADSEQGSSSLETRTQKNTNKNSKQKNGIDNPAVNLEENDEKEELEYVISIMNPEAVNTVDLVNRLRKRFRKKVRKREVQIQFYSSCDSLMTLALLLLQVLQMSVQPLRDVLLSNGDLIIIQNVLVAITALLAGIQLKMKFNEKADRCRKEVRVYYHLLRMTSYYTMMSESGGTPGNENTINLWQQAMKKELESLKSVAEMESV